MRKSHFLSFFDKICLFYDSLMLVCLYSLWWDIAVNILKTIEWRFIVGHISAFADSVIIYVHR